VDGLKNKPNGVIGIKSYDGDAFMPPIQDKLNREAEDALRKSEERFRNILDNSPIALYRRNYQPDSYEYMSPAIYTITGYTPQEIMGMTAENIVELIVPEDRQKVLDQIDAVVARQGGKFVMEYRMRHKSGEIRWLCDTAQFFVDEKGALSHSIGSVEDITERKMIEAALKESQADFQRIIDESPLPMATNNEKGEIEYLNNQYIQTFGYTLEDVPNLDAWWERAYPDARFREETKARWLIAMTAEKDSHALDQSEYRITDKKGCEHIVELLWSTVGGKTLVIFNDISARRQVEEEVRELNATLEKRVQERTEQLESVNQELEAFSYSVSHDLRAPLRAMDGFSKIMLDEYGGSLDEQGLDYLKRIRGASMRMTQLIDDLLKLSHISHSELKIRDVDLCALAGEVVGELRALNPDRQVEVTLMPQLVVRADRGMMHIVLENILGNAWKFTRKRETAHIELGVCWMNGEPVIFLKDDGAGFDMANAQKLFGAFQRLHSLKDFEGNGIGLAIVQRIIHLHGGKIWAEGAVNQGATFYFTLS
jgi:PAS domain S-box-containing protein